MYTWSRKNRLCLFPVLGDGSIDVGYDDFVVPVPQVDGALATTRSLVLSSYAEGDVIWTISQLQAGLKEAHNYEVHWLQTVSNY